MTKEQPDEMDAAIDRYNKAKADGTLDEKFPLITTIKQPQGKIIIKGKVGRRMKINERIFMSTLEQPQEWEIDLQDTFFDREMVVKEGITQIKYKPTQEALIAFIRSTIESVRREEREKILQKIKQMKASLEKISTEPYVQSNKDSWHQFNAQAAILQDIISSLTSPTEQ